MDVYGDSSDVEESQATQMLLDLMPGSSNIRPPSPIKSIQAPLPEVDSFASSRQPNSLPTYHYHGLASTQTQTQSNSEEVQVDEGSQKENIQTTHVVIPSETRQTPRPAKGAANYPSSSKATPANTTNADQHQASHSLTHMKTKTPNPRPMPTPGRDSPRGRAFSKVEKSPAKKPSSYFESRQTKRNPATTPSRDSSQDSFARAPSQDPEEIIAANKQFEVPLSELGRVDLKRHRSSMFSLPIHGGPVVARDQGKVLVEATPSNSASSQSQHLWQETQIISQHFPVPQASDAQSDGYASSDDFGRSLMKPSSPELEQTQPAEETSTGATGPTATTSANAINLPQRHILRMTAHADKHKYAKYRDQMPHLAPSINSKTSSGQQQRGAQQWIATQPTDESGGKGTNWVETQPTTEEDHRPARHWVDTQPTTDEDHRSGAPWIETQPTADRTRQPAPQWAETQPTTEEDLQPPPRPNFVMPRLPPQRLVPQLFPPASPATGRVLTEVIPDSEPIRSSPVRSSPVRPSPAKSPAKPRQPSQSESEEEKRPRKRAKVVAKPKANVVVDDDDAEDSDSHQPVATSRASPTKPGRRREPEVQSDSDDDTPLAANVPAKSRKGKEVVRPHKAVEVAASKTKPDDVVVPKERRTRAGKTVAKGKGKEVALAAPRTRPGRSWETGVVPSSLPEQDHPPPPKPEKGTGVAQATRSRPKRKAAENITYPASSDEDEDELPTANIREPSTRAEDDATGDAGGMDLDQPEAGPSTSARKRKRGYGTRVKKEENIATRLRSTSNRGRSTPASSRSEDRPPARVFAFWSPTREFYAGVIDYIDDASQLYSVKFYDGQEAEVAIGDLRLIKHLRRGDEVQVQRSSILYQFVRFNEATETVILAGNKGEKEVKLAHISISAKTVRNQWKDRMPTQSMLAPRSGTIFGNTSFIVSLSATDTTGSDVRKSLTSLIKTGGGSVDEILHIFNIYPATNPSQWRKRWTIRKTDVRYTAEADQIFLVADEATPKGKYLMALALGIPCLEKEWVEKSVEVGVMQDWRKYLLPQGTCEVTGVRLSQQVNLDWCKNGAQDLHDIMDYSAPNKVFAGASVLCCGDGMEPKQKPGSTVIDNSNYPARIILCMGADYVEVVPSISNAMNKNLANYTYIVASNITEEIRRDVRGHPQLVDWKWVKSCLLSSRLLDIPSAKQ